MTGLPLAPLLDVFPGESLAELADRFGVTARTICRWKRCGQVSAEVADRAAVRCGHHPGEIWSDWWRVA